MAGKKTYVKGAPKKKAKKSLKETKKPGDMKLMTKHPAA
jgi:hypothetical protein